MTHKYPPALWGINLSPLLKGYLNKTSRALHHHSQTTDLSSESSQTKNTLSTHPSISSSQTKSHEPQQVSHFSNSSATTPPFHHDREIPQDSLALQTLYHKYQRIPNFPESRLDFRVIFFRLHVLLENNNATYVISRIHGCLGGSVSACRSISHLV